MQVKTINRVIREKLEEWLSSISDPVLRNDTRKNLILSGGSIASLFLGKEVNDYDIYLQDRDVLRELITYYTDDFNKVVLLDGAYKDRYLKDITREYDDSYSIAVHSLTPDRLKLYFSGNPGYKVEPIEGDPKYCPAFFSPNAISLTDNIQIVLRFWGNPEKIHETLDFIHATNYFTFKDGVVTNISALESLLTMQLRYQGSKYPLTSIIRIKKFLKRGWNISAGEILKILFQVSELDLRDYRVLEEQLMGVDVAYFGKLIEIISNVGDKSKINSLYLNTIIDRVFNEDEGDED